MKTVLLSLALVIFLLPGAGAQDRDREQSTDSTVITALSLVRSDSLLSYVQHLQDFGTRFMIAPNRKEVATWIMNKFISFGITEARLDSFPSYTYVNSPPFLVFDTTTWQYNVEAKITGSVFPSCELVMMAHYDDCVNESDPMIAAPGADDNASGVAALLESARVIMETGYQPRKTFIFLATAAEELMMMCESGAMHYAQEAAAEGRDLSIVLNNDMISWNDGTWSVRFINDTNSTVATDLAAHVIDTYTTLDRTYSTLGTFADLTFFLDEGYEGAYFMESVLNGFTPYYHTLDDVVENIDPEYLTEFARLNLGCFLLSDLLKNEAVLSDISGVPESNCTGLLSPVISIFNNGSDTLTSIDIVCRVNNESPLVVPWTGNLPFRETVQVELAAFPFGLLPENKLEITLENINGKEDEIVANNTREIQFGMADATPEEIKLKIRLDGFPQETTWEIKDDNDDVVYSGGPYTTPNTLVSETMVFTDPGCYAFNAYDAGGDGIQSGFILLYYGTNSTIMSVFEFESFVQTQFDVGGTLQTEEFSRAGEITFYPNPVHEEGYIEFTLDRNASVEVTVFNLLGQRVIEMPEQNSLPGVRTITIPAGQLAPGLFTVMVRIGEKVVTGKMIKE